MFGSRVGVVYRHVRLVQILSAWLSLRVLHLPPQVGCRGYRLGYPFTGLQSCLIRQEYVGFLITVLEILTPLSIRTTAEVMHYVPYHVRQFG